MNRWDLEHLSLGNHHVWACRGKHCRPWAAGNWYPVFGPTPEKRINENSLGPLLWEISKYLPRMQKNRQKNQHNILLCKQIPHTSNWEVHVQFFLESRMQHYSKLPFPAREKRKRHVPGWLLVSVAQCVHHLWSSSFTRDWFGAVRVRTSSPRSRGRTDSETSPVGRVRHPTEKRVLPIVPINGSLFFFS